MLIKLCMSKTPIHSTWLVWKNKNSSSGKNVMEKFVNKKQKIIQ
jgi:hypothetical protein